MAESAVYKRQGGGKSIAQINSQVARIQRELSIRGEGDSDRMANVYAIADRYTGNARLSSAMRQGASRIERAARNNPNYDWFDDWSRDLDNIRIPRSQYMGRRNNRR